MTTFKEKLKSKKREIELLLLLLDGSVPDLGGEFKYDRWFNLRSKEVLTDDNLKMEIYKTCAEFEEDPEYAVVYFYVDKFNFKIMYPNEYTIGEFYKDYYLYEPIDRCIEPYEEWEASMRKDGVPESFIAQIKEHLDKHNIDNGIYCGPEEDSQDEQD